MCQTHLPFPFPPFTKQVRLINLTTWQRFCDTKSEKKNHQVSVDKNKCPRVDGLSDSG